MGILETIAADSAAAKIELAALKTEIAALRLAIEKQTAAVESASSQTAKSAGMETAAADKSAPIEPKNPQKAGPAAAQPGPEKSAAPGAEPAPNSNSISEIDKRLRHYLAEKPEEGMAACRAKIKKWELTPIRNICNQEQLDAWGVFLSEKGY